MSFSCGKFLTSVEQASHLLSVVQVSHLLSVEQVSHLFGRVSNKCPTCLDECPTSASVCAIPIVQLISFFVEPIVLVVPIKLNVPGGKEVHVPRSCCGA
jgi:hypothetical protein